MKIALSVCTRKDQNIWENGIGQNVALLFALLQDLPFVEQVYLLDVGSEGIYPEMLPNHKSPANFITMQESAFQVDVVIEMGGALDPAWMRLMRARGKKLIYMCCGNPYSPIEQIIFKTGKVDVREPSTYDEVWMLPTHRAFSGWMRTLYRSPVYILPYLWDARFVEQRAAQVEKIGYQYGFPSTHHSDSKISSEFNVAIFEPNISLVKTSIISMLACNNAYALDRTSIKLMHVLNTLHIKDHLTMLHFANSLEIVKEHKAIFHGRHDTVGFICENKINLVVSHQWENEQNYLYLDVLYGGYPLVHNSKWLSSVGYYYPDFDSNAAARQINSAITGHHEILGDYKKQVALFIDLLSPCHPSNLAAYAAALLRVCE